LRSAAGSDARPPEPRWRALAVPTFDEFPFASPTLAMFTAVIGISLGLRGTFSNDAA
jgi:hypothetical protein